MAARSSSPGFTNQVPPTHSTDGTRQPFRRRFGPDAAGRAEADWPNGADSAFSAGNAARGLGGKEFEAVEAEVEPAHDVAGGRDARQIRDARLARRRRASGSVRPGETMNWLPASIASAELRARLSTVPAPTIAPGDRRTSRGSLRAPERRAQRHFEHRQSGLRRTFRPAPPSHRLLRAPAPGSPARRA